MIYLFPFFKIAAASLLNPQKLKTLLIVTSQCR